MKQTDRNANTESPVPPGVDAVFLITCKDVVMGRGSGTQNHCGNVTYRKLVYLNKELYATSTKFDKLKISKAIVAAIRKFGGRFLQAEAGGEDKGHFDIGDKRAWDKTSQALREGQVEVRAKLAAEEKSANMVQKVAEFEQVISTQTFLAYACKILESLYDPNSGFSHSCGPSCTHAKRRATLNRTDAMALQHAMYMQQQQLLTNHHQPQINDSSNMRHTFSESINPLPSMNVPPIGEDLNSLEPLPYNMDFYQPQARSQPQCTKSLHQHFGEDSQTWEPLELNNRNRDTLTSIDFSILSNDTTSTIRQMLCDDVDMDSVEMSKQLSEMIRRKSQGLVRIDAVEAFEDLVFEEDSASHAKFDFPEPQVSNARSLSGFSERGDSLMNMSLLSIDDKDGTYVSNAKRLSRVSFAPENVSAMSMDISSMNDIVNDKKIGRTSYESQESDNPHSRSRSMGFPIRKTVLRQQREGVPTVIPAQRPRNSNFSTLTTSDASAIAAAVQPDISGVPTVVPTELEGEVTGRLSTLTFTDAAAVADIMQRDIEFVEMTKDIVPPSSNLSLKDENMTFSNMSLLSTVDESILGEDKKGVNQV